jgi:hypothetical protein
LEVKTVPSYKKTINSNVYVSYFLVHANILANFMRVLGMGSLFRPFDNEARVARPNDAICSKKYSHCTELIYYKSHKSLFSKARWLFLN